MSEQADQPEQPVVPQADEPQSRRSSSSRFVLFAILGIFVVVLVFDLYSRWRAETAYDKLYLFTGEYERSFEDDADRAKVRYGRNDITMSVVKGDEYIGKDPDEAADPNQASIRETFTFYGCMKHVLIITYSQAAPGDSDETPDPYFIDVELVHVFPWQKAT